MALQFERERWRRTIEAAGPGDVADLRKIALQFLDGYFGMREVAHGMTLSRVFDPPVVDPDSLSR